MGMGGCLSPGLGSTQLTGGLENYVIITRVSSDPRTIQCGQALTPSSRKTARGQVSHLEPIYFFRLRSETYIWHQTVSKNVEHRRLLQNRFFFCPGWEISFVPVSQSGPPRPPFVPGQITGTKEDFWSRLVVRPFGPAWCYQPGPKGPFFSFFLLGYFYSISDSILYWNLSRVWTPLI